MFRLKVLSSISRRSWVLAALSAGLQVVMFPLAGPVPAWRRLLCWVCLVPLLLALLPATPGGRKLSPGQAALVGYACGVLFYFANCYWIYQTMHIYGGLPPVAAMGVLSLFSVYLGLYHGLLGLTFGFLQQRWGPRGALVVWPFLWVAVEMARAQITGFPWDLLGYTQVENGFLTHMAPLTGVMGLSLLVAGVNCLWLLPIGRGGRRTIWGGPVLAMGFVGCCSLAPWLVRVPAELPRQTAVLLQDNLLVGAARVGLPETKAGLLASLVGWTTHPVTERSGEGGKKVYLLTQGGPRPDILAWPEAPTDFFSGDPEFRETGSQLAKATDAPLIVDTATAEAPSEPTGKVQEYASAAFFDADGRYAGRYDKMHLVPFGEYVPYKPLFFFAGHLLDGLGFSPGTVRHNFVTAGHSFGVFICYESVFGDEVREFAKMGAEVLVNLSDDGWYGDTSAPWEHLDMVRMRAIENRRWVLRATNTGVTGAIDPEGRLVTSLPRHVRSALVAPFSYRRDVTFYTRYGDWLGWMCAGVVVVALLAAVNGWRPSGALAPGIE